MKEFFCINSTYREYEEVLCYTKSNLIHMTKVKKEMKLINAKIYSFKEGEEYFKKLEDSLEKSDSINVGKLLKDEIGVKSLIGIRGENGGCLNLIKNAILFLFKEKGLQIEKVFESDTSSWFDVFHEQKIDEKNLDYLMRVTFHLRDKRTFNFLKKLTLDNKANFINIHVYYWLLHGIASWEHVVKNSFESSIEKNIEVLKNMQENGDQVLYWKAKSGLAFSKSLSPKLKIEDFLKVGKELEELGDLFEAFRSYIEAARASLDLSKQQGTQAIGFEKLRDAEKIAKEALMVSKEIGYANIEIIATEVLKDVCEEMEEKILVLGTKLREKSLKSKELEVLYEKQEKKLSSYQAKNIEYQFSIEKLRNQYVYKTEFSQKYKKSMYKHL